MEQNEQANSTAQKTAAGDPVFRPSDARRFPSRNLWRRRFFQFGEIAAMLLICGGMFYLGMRLFSDCGSWLASIVLMSIGILGFTSVFILSIMRFLRRTWVQLFVFCFIFVLGCYSHFYGNSSGEAAPRIDGMKQEADGVVNKDEGPIRKLIISYCSAISEFFPSRGPYDSSRTEENFSGKALLFFFLSIVFSVSIVIAIWGSKITNRWHLFLSGMVKRSVFWCSIPGRKELILADDIYGSSSTEQCIFAVEEFSVSNVYVLQNNLNFKGHLLCLRKPGQFHRVCLGADNHFFLTEDYDWNINMAQDLWEKLRFRKKRKTVHFYIRVPDDERDVWAEHWAEEIQKISGFANPASRAGGTSIDIHLISEASLIARMLVEKHPLLNSPRVEIDPKSGTVEGEFRILLLGFGEIGKAILRETVCDGQFLKRGGDAPAPFSVDIVDSRREAFSYCRARLGEAVEKYHLNFFDHDALSGEFYQMIESRLASYNRIVIAFKNDSLNLEIAARIREISKRRNIRFGKSGDADARLLMRVSNRIPAMDLAAVSPDSTHAWLSRIDFFGMIDDCYGRDIIIDEVLDSRAKRVNKIYDSRATDESWLGMSMFERESNRSCASGLGNLLRLAGMEEKDFSAEAWACLIDGPLLETLAGTEHLRWCAFHLMRGIRAWPLAEITDDDVERLHKPNDIKARLRHAALVDYKDLPAVDRRFGRDGDCLLQNNRMVVLNIGKVLGP